MRKNIFISMALIAFFSVGIGSAMADNEKRTQKSEDGTCLVEIVNYGEGEQNCTWYLVNFLSKLPEWRQYVNPTIQAEIDRLLDGEYVRTKKRRDEAKRNSQRNQIAIIQSAK